MKITDRLLGDHKAFRKILEDLDADAKMSPGRRDSSALRRRAALLKRMIVFHASYEDAVYFPAVERAAKPGDIPEGLVAHLVHEHKTIEGYLSRFEAQVNAVPPTPSWPQTFALLSAGLRGHFKREEEELFPASERLLGGDLSESLAAGAPVEGAG